MVEGVKQENTGREGSLVPTEITIDDFDDSDEATDYRVIYNLTQADFRSEAFSIFVDYLYNTLPKTIKNAKDAKIAIRAYALAMEY